MDPGYPWPLAPQVYPRVGGGTLAPSSIVGFSGLSPRGRGNPATRYSPFGSLDGSIPAWAGEPPTYSPVGTQPLMTVYPRVGGGTQKLISYPDVAIGLSPRGRGNPAMATHAQRVHPRVGGGTTIYSQSRTGASLTRSIPAWAGEPSGGLSPRGRGNRRRPGASFRSIPAWAGEPTSTVVYCTR